jgi:hypothetical protein
VKKLCGDHLGELGLDRKIILKWILDKCNVKVQTGLTDQDRNDTLAVGSTILNFWLHKSREILDQISNYQLLKVRPRVRIPAGAGNFSLQHCVQTSSGAHPASYPVGTRGSFPGGKEVGA